MKGDFLLKTIVLFLFFIYTYAYAQWVDVDGVGQESAIIRGYNDGLSSSNPDLFLDYAGNPGIVWCEHSTDIGIVGICYLKWNGNAWVDAAGINQTGMVIFDSGFNPVLYLDNFNMPHITWQNGYYGIYDIYYLYWNGSAWVDATGSGQANINISNNTGNSQNPTLALDNTGKPHIAWADNTNGNYDIYYLYWNGSAWVDATGSGQANINISNNTGNSQNPTLALDNTGKPHIAWADNTNGNYDIYYLYWNGSAWVDSDGTGQESIKISNSPMDPFNMKPTLCLDNNFNPCIAWNDGYALNYLKWNNGSWVDADGIGTESAVIPIGGLPSMLKMKLNNNDNPCIIWQDNNLLFQSAIYYLWWNVPTPTPTKTIELYSGDDIIIYPNPFSIERASNNVLKIINAPLNSVITIYTVSAEMVVSIGIKSNMTIWNGKNIKNIKVSPGIYYYIITKDKKVLKKGKLYIYK